MPVRGIAVAVLIGLSAALSPAAARAFPTRQTATHDWTLVDKAFRQALARMGSPAGAPPRATPSSAVRPAAAPPPSAAAPTREPTPPSPAAPSSPPETTGDADTGPAAGFPWITEIRAGALVHDVPIAGSRKEEGIDANLELRFKPLPLFAWLPDSVDFLHEVRPHIGATFNAKDDATDFVYAGVTWTWGLWKSLYMNFSFGGTVHNGINSDNVDPAFRTNRTEFGCEALFRESLEIGWRFTERHDLSAMIDHVSHGGLCDDNNQGMDTAGIRYGYHF